MWPKLFLIALTIFTCIFTYGLMRQTDGNRGKVLWVIFGVLNSVFLGYNVLFYKDMWMLNRILSGVSAIGCTALVLLILKQKNLKAYALVEVMIGLSSSVVVCWTLGPDTPVTLSQPVALLGSVYLLVRGFENGAKGLDLL